MPKTDAEVTKIAVALPPRALEMLKSRSTEKGITMTEFIRRAIALYGLVTDEPDNEIVIRNKRLDKDVLVHLV